MPEQLGRRFLLRHPILTCCMLLAVLLLAGVLLAAFTSAIHAEGVPARVVQITDWAASAGTNLQAQVSYTIANQGTGSVTGYSWDSCASSAPLLDAGESHAGRLGTPAWLSPSASRDFSGGVTTPGNAGTYFLLIHVDAIGRIIKEDETNNVAAINSLKAFIEAVGAHQGPALTGPQAEELISSVNTIIAPLTS